jgi:hypothetical protein
MRKTPECMVLYQLPLRRAKESKRENKGRKKDDESSKLFFQTKF